MSDFLPICKQDLIDQGITQPDFIYITGDAYVDHPSFGVAIISRLLQARGYTMVILSQPNWKNDADFLQFGEPKLGFLITSGNIDSMVAHYTVAKKKRSRDVYTAGGVMGKRPDRAAIVYSRIVRRLFPNAFIGMGGLEASLRRFAHYDYWDDDIRPSILVDSQADIVMYGMGEHQIQEIAQVLRDGGTAKDMRGIRGICYLCKPEETPYGTAQCPSFEQVKENKKEYAVATRIQYDQQDEVYGKTITQRHGKQMLVQTPPAYALTTEELDEVYSLPYTRDYHPIYEKDGGVPGIEEVKFSVTHNRGCFGYCNFCSIALHQGRKISCRSKESVLAEARALTQREDFKGYIHDVGGPTANFRRPSCAKQEKYGLCKGKKCLAPEPCKALQVDHSEYLEILQEMRKIPGVKRVFIRSGIRYDYLMEDKDDSFMRELIKEHVSGQLKVAPEHCSAVVLDKMGKPHIEAYKAFQEKFYKITKQVKKEQYLVPYLMSSHPGSTLRAAVDLSLFLRDNHMRPEQVQDFYPTPGTISTCMFHTGLDPYTMEPVYVPKTSKEKAMQRALLQYFKPSNQEIVRSALRQCGRTDLIGTKPGCLVPPDPKQKEKEKKGKEMGKARNNGNRSRGRNTESRPKRKR